MHANLSVSEPKPPGDADSPLAFSMEGYKGIPPAGLMSRYWAPGWNSVQALNKFQEEVGGLLMGNSLGRRLIEASEDGETSYFREIPAAYVLRDNEFLVVPLYHIFGSEELSRLSPPISERSPAPYVMVGKGMKVNEGQEIQVDLNGYSLRLPARVSEALPDGVAGLPVSLLTIPAALPMWCRLKVMEGVGE